MNSSSNVSRIRGAAVFGLMSLTAGCYLSESVQGQLSLMSKRQPIARAIQSPSMPPTVRAQLEEVIAIRDFATRELGLPDNGSYRSYADVGRPYVVWNVVAAPEFSVEAVQWCFPVVGCVAYRGYFVEHRAESFAAKLRARDFDVSVGGVAAYSTLGHFNDPVLNTMMGWSDVDLAATIFHELVHQMIYLPNDASFNEALATTIEEEGVRRWLVAKRRETDLAAHLVQQRHYLQVIELLRRTRSELRALYASGLGATDMRRRKRATFDALRDSYAQLKAPWAGRAPFDTWFAGEINNAHLASIATYYDCVPGFERELSAVQGDLGAFYRRVHELAKLDRAARDAAVCVRP